MKLLWLLSIGLASAGPITLVPSSQTLLFGAIIERPGAILNLPALYTFHQPGAPPPDFKQCGQIGFIPTLPDGSPDLTAIPSFLQINTPCSKPVLEGLFDPRGVSFNDTHEPPANVPEPSTRSFAMGFLAGLTVYRLWRNLLP